jgi:hypothetical protein
MSFNFILPIVGTIFCTIETRQHFETGHLRERKEEEGGGKGQYVPESQKGHELTLPWMTISTMPSFGTATGNCIRSLGEGRVIGPEWRKSLEYITGSPMDLFQHT